MEDHDTFPEKISLLTPELSKADQLRQTPLTHQQKNRLPKVIQKQLGSATNRWCLVPKEYEEIFRYDETALRFEDKRSEVVKVKRFAAGSSTRWLLVRAKTNNNGGSAPVAAVSAMEARSAYAAEQYLSQQRLTPEQQAAASRVFSDRTNGVNEPSVCFTLPTHGSNISVPADPAQWRSPITFNERTVLVKEGESATTLAQTHYGRPDTQLIYKMNASLSPSIPFKKGDRVTIRDGAAIEFGLSTRNVSQVRVTATGAVNKTLTVDILNAGPEYVESRASLPAKTGTYQLQAEADGVSHHRTFQVEVIPAPSDWLKVTASYADTWQTPIPLRHLTVQVNGVNHSTNLALNEGTGTSETVDSDWMADRTRHDPGALVVDTLPVGDVNIIIETEGNLENRIRNETERLIRGLDGAYRSLVADMSTFQARWDEFGYSAIAIDGRAGLLAGEIGWVKDQADLFEAETWQALGNTLGNVATRTLDVTADYATGVYEQLKDTAHSFGNAVDQADLDNWQWWQTQADDAIEAVQAQASDYANQVKNSIDDALQTLDRTQLMLRKFIQHKEAIYQLPELMARGDVNAIQHFIDTVLMDIDPEIANAVKDNPDFHIVLALLENSDVALTYLAYATLIFEAVPPNFYAYNGGKGGAYLAIECLLLVLMSLLTLGSGTAARVSMLMAKLAARSAKAANATQKLKKVQQALDAFIGAIKELTESSEQLKSIGQKLVIARNKGVLIKGKTGSTLSAKRETTKRDVRCRYCKSDKHSTPKKLKGNVQVA